MAIRAKLTTAGDNATPASAASAPDGAAKSERSEEEKAARKERVQKAKDALARSTSLKGEHVAPARQAIKLYLQRLNEPRQPDDATFEAILEAPFKVPAKKAATGPRGR